MSPSDVGFILLILLYVGAIGAFFWFLFIPLQEIACLLSFGAGAWIVTMGLAATFRLDWKRHRARIVFIGYFVFGLALEWIYFAFSYMGFSSDLHFGARQLNWWAGNLVHNLPEHFVVRKIFSHMDSLNGVDGYIFYLIVLILIKFAASIPLVTAGRKLSTIYEIPGESREPAYKNYFFHQAFLDMKRLVINVWHYSTIFFQKVFSAGRACFTGDIASFAWPIGVVVFAATPIPAAITFLFSLVMLISYMAITLFCVAVAAVIMALLNLMERLSLAIRGIFMVCPNAGCYKKITLPLYKCPDCGREHRHLVPSSFGVFSRICQCGKRLPTLFISGRGKLPAFCPHCNRSLVKEIGVTQNAHVPVIGGPSAGKSSFLVAAYLESEKYMESRDGKVTLVDGPLKRRFESLVESFKSGVTVSKTSATPPDAVLFRVHKEFDVDMTDALVYLYDPGGEVFEAQDRLSPLRYLKDASGLVFLIDPFSLEAVRDRHLKAIEAVGDLSPSEASPQQLFDRLVSVLQAYKGKSRRSVFSLPLSVVLSKMDAFTHDRSAGAPGIEAPSQEVRAWLIHDAREGNLVRSIENYFKGIQYFSCSALGRMPSSKSSAFEAKGVLAPLRWALGKKDVF